MKKLRRGSEEINVVKWGTIAVGGELYIGEEKNGKVPYIWDYQEIFHEYPIIEYKTNKDIIGMTNTVFYDIDDVQVRPPCQWEWVEDEISNPINDDIECILTELFLAYDGYPLQRLDEIKSLTKTVDQKIDILANDLMDLSGWDKELAFNAATKFYSHSEIAC